jgi:hypothetical protein
LLFLFLFFYLTSRITRAYEDEKAQLATFKKELKGAKYTYDHSGQVVVLARGSDGQYPPTMLRPGVRLDSNGKDEEEDADKKKKGAASKKNGASGPGLTNPKVRQRWMRGIDR